MRHSCTGCGDAQPRPRETGTSTVWSASVEPPGPAPFMVTELQSQLLIATI